MRMISGAIAVVVVGSLVASAWGGEAGTSYGGFPAIPNLTSIRPAITITRTSGETPLGMQVSAEETVAEFSDGGSAFRKAYGRAFNAFTDLHYEWDFGDAANARSETTFNGKPVSPNRDQAGPLAAYVYRKPGTFTVRLTARGRLPDGRYVEATATELKINEIHQVELRSDAKPFQVTGGTWRLSADGGKTWTGHIAWDALSATPDPDPGQGTPEHPYRTIQAALQKLLGAENVLVSGGACWKTGSPALVEFRGALGGSVREQLLVGDASGLLGPGKNLVRVIRYAGGSKAPAVKVSDYTSGQVAFFDSSAADGGDGSIERPYNAKVAVTMAQWLSADNRRACVKRGSVFTTAERIAMGPKANNRSVVAYGEGPRPVLKYTGDKTLFYCQTAYVPGWHDGGNFVLDGLELRSTGAASHLITLATNIYVANPFDPLTKWGHTLISDCMLAGPTERNLVETPLSMCGHDLLLWNCQFDQPTGRIDVLGGVSRWMGIIGCTFAERGQDKTNVRIHHVYTKGYYRMQHRWLRSLGMGNRLYLLNLDVLNRRDQGGQCRYVCVDQVDTRNTTSGVELSNADNSYTADIMSPQYGKFVDAVVQRSLFNSTLSKTYGHGVWAIACTNLTIRDNDFFGNENSDITLSDPNGRGDVYRNRAWNAKANHSFLSLNAADGYATQNMVVNAGALETGGMVKAKWPEELARWRFFGNTWFAPGAADGPDGSKLMFHEETSKSMRSLKQWIDGEWSQDDQYADPAWNDPPRGDFGKRGTTVPSGRKP